MCSRRLIPRHNSVVSLFLIHPFVHIINALSSCYALDISSHRTRVSYTIHRTCSSFHCTSHHRSRDSLFIPVHILRPRCTPAGLHNRFPPVIVPRSIHSPSPRSCSSTSFAHDSFRVSGATLTSRMIQTISILTFHSCCSDKSP